MSETSTPVPETASRYGTRRAKVPAYARYVGTSAWTKNRRRAREYARFRAAEKLKRGAAAPNG